VPAKAAATKPQKRGSRSEPKAEIAPAQPVVRTGSTDRHHLIVDEVADEPLAPVTGRRPRTYRDLDEIPDDLE
jgi:hypothetical protein